MLQCQWDVRSEHHAEFCAWMNRASFLERTPVPALRRHCCPHRSPRDLAQVQILIWQAELEILNAYQAPKGCSHYWSTDDAQKWEPKLGFSNFSTHPSYLEGRELIKIIFRFRRARVGLSC